METRPGWIFSSRRWERTASPSRKRTCCELRSFSKRFNRVVPYVNVEFCAPEQRLGVSRGGVFLQRKEKAFIGGQREGADSGNKWTACMSPCSLLEDSPSIKSKRFPYILHSLSSKCHRDEFVIHEQPGSDPLPPGWMSASRSVQTRDDCKGVIWACGSHQTRCADKPWIKLTPSSRSPRVPVTQSRWGWRDKRWRCSWLTPKCPASLQVTPRHTNTRTSTCAHRHG